MRSYPEHIDIPVVLRATISCCIDDDVTDSVFAVSMNSSVVDMVFPESLPA